MTRPATHPDTAATTGDILCVCRDPSTRALLQRFVPDACIHLSAAEALLAAARRPPAHIILAFDSTETSVGDVAAAFRRAHPDVPVYAVVQAVDEPATRGLLGTDLDDYVVLPRDVCRLPALLSQRPEPAEPHRPAETVPRALFEASCRLADLAMAEPTSLFREGARTILGVFGAARGCAFVWSEKDERLDLVLTVGGNEALGAVDPEPVRAAASRCLRTGERLRLPAGVSEAPPDGLACLPVRDAESAIGVICLSGPAVDGSSAAEPGSGAEALAGILARLYRAAVRRQELARLAHRDVETGLLKANPFLAYVDSRIAEARGRDTELALILLEPEASVAARTADSPARLGLAVRGALARGWEAGRLGTVRYAVTLSPSEEEASAGAEAVCESAARRMAGVAPRAHPDLLLRTAVARFPKDGATAEALVSAAERRLRASVEETT